MKNRKDVRKAMNDALNVAFNSFQAKIAPDHFQLSQVDMPPLFQQSLVQTQYVEEEIKKQKFKLDTVKIASTGRIKKAKELVAKLQNESTVRIQKKKADIIANIGSQAAATNSYGSILQTVKQSLGFDPEQILS